MISRRLGGSRNITGNEADSGLQHQIFQGGHPFNGSPGAGIGTGTGKGTGIFGEAVFALSQVRHTVKIPHSQPAPAAC